MRTVREKVLDYLKNRAKPCTIKQIAKHFIISEAGVYRVLTELSEENIVSRQKLHGKTYGYKLCPTETSSS